MGRAGRFGTKGLAITFVTEDSEKKKEKEQKSDMEILEEIQSRFVVDIKPLPDTIDVSTYSKICSEGSECVRLLFSK